MMKSLCLWLLLSPLTLADTPPEQPQAELAQPRFPELTGPVIPVPPPNSVQELRKGQWYIIDFDRPMLISPITSGGEVTVVAKKGPLPVPAEIAIGRKPDKDEPDICTIAGPYIYIVKGKTSGKLMLDTIPATNAIGANGKVIPFTEKDFIRRELNIVLETPPVVVPPVVDPAADAIRKGYAADTELDKANSVAVLASYYRGAARDYTKDPKVKVWSDFAYALKAGREQKLGQKIPKTRAALLQQIFDAWPDDAAKPFDDASRQTAADSLIRAAGILEQIK